MKEDAINKMAVNKLTVLWALSESGLGGFMHAFKLPLIGFFVGGFAVVMVSLLAYYSQRNFKIILQSTLLVLLVKFAVSPQSPLSAYFSVSFQGFTGAILFSLLPNFRLASLLFGFVALMESGLHMPISKTIFYGMYLWEAIDLFFKSILKEFSIQTTLSFSVWILFIYVAFYAAWGLVLGVWIGGVPQKIENKSGEIVKNFNSLTLVEQDVDGIKKSKRKFKYIGVIFTLLFLITTILLSGEDKKNALYIVLRTVGVLLFIFYILSPFIKWLFKKIAGERSAQIQSVIDEFPSIKNKISPAYQLASMGHNGFSRYKEFVFILIVIALTSDTHSSNGD